MIVSSASVDTLDFITERIAFQVSVFKSRAKRYRNWYWVLKILQIIAAATVPVIPAFGIGEHGSQISALLGALVIALETIQQTFQLHKHWLNFECTVDQLEQEMSLYTGRAGPYKGKSNPTADLYERVEIIINQSNTRWMNHEESSGRKEDDSSEQGQTSSFMMSESKKALFTAISEIPQSLKDNPEEYAKFIVEQVDKLPGASAPQVSKSALPLAGLRVLWVDDNPANNRYEVNLLQNLGATRILQVTSTDEALASLEGDTTFDVLISDLGRTENGKFESQAGYKLLASKEIREGSIPIVFYTSWDNVARCRRANHLATNSPNDLVKILQKLIKQTPPEKC